MRLPDDPHKYSSQFQFVEFGHYVPKINKLIRLKDGDDPLLFTWDEINDKIKQHGEAGLYTSIFHYNNRDFHSAIPMGSLYFDLDNKSEPEIALSETYKVLSHLLEVIPRDAIRIYFSGQKGFHIECEALALGVSATDDLAGVFRFIADDIHTNLKIQSFDFSVYDLRRMWRIPNTRHQSTGLYKVECMQLFQEGAGLTELTKYASSPRPIEVPEQQFSFKANQWYREYVYAYEQSLAPKRPTSDMIARFLEQGTHNIRNFDTNDRFFDKFRLLKGCPAIRELELKAKRDHHLDHYERLFLCSILTYHDDAIRYLHEILSECNDYKFEVSNAHIDDWIRRRERGIGGRPFSCQKAKQVGVVCSGCNQLEPRHKIEKLADGKYIETDEVSSPSPVRLAYSTSKFYSTL